MKSSLLKKRILASIIDHLIVLGYLGVLLLVGILMGLDEANFNPYTGQVIGFLILTLVVYFYFSLTENSKAKASLGKRCLKISVEKGNVFYRNFLKLLPWEVAHTGVHWVIYFSNKGLETPLWNFGLLIAPQIIVIIYFFSMIQSKGRQAIYDKWSGVEMVLND